MSRAARRRWGRRPCAWCGKVFHAHPKLERHEHVHRVAEESGQTFEEASRAIAVLITRGILIERRDGNLDLNEDRAHELLGEEEAS